MRRSSRWLWPREHGAYAEVLFPLGTALCVGEASLSSVALSFAIVAAFLAHEPLSVLLGVRGAALQREAGSRARAQGALLGSASAAAAVLGLGHAESTVRWVAAALLPALLLALALTLSKREKSLVGEIVIALVFAFAAAPVALAAGSSARAALQAALTWSAIFLVGTATVHALLARKKRGRLAPSRAVVASCAVLCAAAVFSGLSGYGWWPTSAIPMLLVSAAALLLGLPPKRLKLLGWAMVIAHLIAALGLWVALRRPPTAAVFDTFVAHFARG